MMFSYCLSSVLLVVLLTTKSSEGAPAGVVLPTMYTVTLPPTTESNEEDSNGNNGGTYAPYGGGTASGNQPDNCQTNIKETIITKIQSIIGAFDTVRSPLTKVIESTWSSCKKSGTEVHNI